MAQINLKNPAITMIFTDIHLKESNCNEIKELLIGQGIEICKTRRLKRCFCLGDVFDSRIAQKQEVLSTWDEILDAYDKAGIEVVCIRGNHDSSDYKSSNSFLKPYKHHPNFRLVDDIDIIEEEGYLFGCIAYYDENIWIERFEELKECILDQKKNEKLICLGHMEITGSSNLGHVTENKLKPSSFKDFDMTFLGHFHDQQELNEKVIHLGSLIQNNFGEDEQKGFWIINSDLSYELIPSKGKKYKKQVIDLDTMTFKQADKLIKDLKTKNPDDYVRVELTGGQDTLKSIDKKVYQELGIDVKLKAKELEVNEVEVAEEVKVLTNNDIVSKFKDWCKENDYNYKEGFNILKQVL